LQYKRRRALASASVLLQRLPYSDPLDFIQRRRVFQGGCIAEFFAQVRGAHDPTHTFASRVFGMSPTKITSRGASALPSWAANAFSKL
jgi:hypothetical protein